MKSARTKRRATIVSIDILKLRYFTNNPNAIKIAFPVLAYECEVKTPCENNLDAYEEAALKFVLIGLSINGIANALNINESLARQILSKLEMEKFIVRHKGIGFSLLEHGKKYLQGIKEERASENSHFGFMFVSALKKDVLPFFLEGDIGKVDRTDGSMMDCKLTIKDENTTFAHDGYVPKRWKLGLAYKQFLDICRLGHQVEDDEISYAKAQDIYAEFDSFDEAEYSNTEVQADSLDENILMPLGYGAFVRPLKRPPQKLFLKMQIIISPDVPRGFIAESPLNLSGIDNEFFLRQIKWMQTNGDVLYNGQSLNQLIDSEVLKLCATCQVNTKSAEIFILEKLPLLSAQKDKFYQIYNDVYDLYGLINGSNMTQVARESVVTGLNKKLLEGLLNKILKSKTQTDLQIIKDKALSDMNSLHDVVVVSIAKKAMVSRQCLPELKILRCAVNKLDRTLGNSIAEKLINALVIFYYLPSPQIQNFVKIDRLEECINTIMRLNAIRNKTIHDTDKGEMTLQDYNYYISNVFTVGNRLLEALKEKN